MQTRYRRTIVGTGLAFALSSGSEAGIERNLAGGRETIECGGQSVELNGYANVVRVEVAAAISALGDRNKVTWARGIGGKAPKVTSLGSGNDIARISE